MAGSASRATIVLSADVPRRLSPAACEAWLGRPSTASVPMTWVADAETLALAAAVLRPGTNHDFALRIAPDWLESKQVLRRRLSEARHAMPGLMAAVHRGPRPLSHRTLFVEEGFQIVLVDGFSDERRASRRPPPSGWACRNLAWGLWEVMVAAPFRGGLLAWLWQGGSLPRPTPGSLRVLHAGGTDLVGGVAASSVRLERWLAWAERRTASGRAVTISLANLADVLARGGSLPLGGSVLKAA